MLAGNDRVTSKRSPNSKAAVVKSPEGLNLIAPVLGVISTHLWDMTTFFPNVSSNSICPSKIRRTRFFRQSSNEARLASWSKTISATSFAGRGNRDSLPAPVHFFGSSRLVAELSYPSAQMNDLLFHPPCSTKLAHWIFCTVVATCRLLSAAHGPNGSRPRPPLQRC